MRILLIGCGKMGSALVDCWLKSGVDNHSISVIEPNNSHPTVKTYKNAESLPKTYMPDYMVLTVKPQSFPDVSKTLTRFDGCIIISIMAGIKQKTIEQFFKNSPVIRTMPNLPTLVGQGVIAGLRNKKLSTDQHKKVSKLIKALGTLFWFNDENDIDKVTAISGSGPAYIYLFMQSMIEAAEKLGINNDDATKLVTKTIKGSLKLAETSETNLDQLKQNITSKGGTTEAALNILEKNDALKL